jgi:hypothetical protein
VAATGIVGGQGDTKATVSLASRGGSAKVALETFAQALGATLKYDAALDPDEDLDYHVWIRLKSAQPERAARLMSVAVGKSVRYDAGRRQVQVGEAPEGAGKAGTLKGYDVSVAAGRFVTYQNDYGKPAPAPSTQDGQPAAPAEKCAAVYLANLLTVLVGTDDGGPDFAVTGDRLLLRDDAAMHARVQEALDLLASDHGGHSAELAAEVALRDKLRKAKPPLSLDETPRASILAQLCEIADVDYVIRHDLVDTLEQDHTSVTLPASATVADALTEVFTALTGQWVLSEGAVVTGAEFFTPNGYRVFDCQDLLKKLDAGYVKQRTAPDRAKGFTGGLRSEGGIDVVTSALVKLLGEGGSWVLVDSFGARVVVRGTITEVEAAEAALKAMGWESPKKE